MSVLSRRPAHPDFAYAQDELAADAGSAASAVKPSTERLCGHAQIRYGIQTHRADWRSGKSAADGWPMQVFCDFGKAHPAFQAALSDRPKFRQLHEILNLASLYWLEIPRE